MCDLEIIVSGTDVDLMPKELQSKLLFSKSDKYISWQFVHNNKLTVPASFQEWERFKNVILSKGYIHWQKYLPVDASAISNINSTAELHVIVTSFHLAENLDIKEIFESSGDTVSIAINQLCGKKFLDKLPPQNKLLVPSAEIQKKLLQKYKDNTTLGEELFSLGRLFK
ncbi:MAG: hypothetical protein J7M11_00410, partial [Elusimicrobia bacterium]|nr:hypothetical protein [Elusimicrobiota bacterium]